MKNYNEMLELNSVQFFDEIFFFITNGIKNKTASEVVKKALKGIQDEEVKIFKEAFIISELSAKGYISFAKSECLIEFL